MRRRTGVMDRRVFLGVLSYLAVSAGAHAQPAEKIARIAVLRSEHRPVDALIRDNIAALRAGLQDAGLADGQDYGIDYRSPKTEADIAVLARALVQGKVDVIHASAYAAIAAARDATATIPIVAHDYEVDPVAAGFVASLARPGGNITGMFLDLPEIAGKLLELLKTALPGVRRIAVLWDPLTGTAQVAAVEQGAKALDLEINILEARAGRLEQLVRAAAERRARALVLLGSPVVSREYATVARAAARARLPAISLFPRYARLGGLMSYGPETVDQYRQEGRMIAKILKGARPAELPVERPTRFYFLINLTAARALGLVIPPSLLQRADQVIE